MIGRACIKPHDHRDCKLSRSRGSSGDGDTARLRPPRRRPAALGSADSGTIAHQNPNLSWLVASLGPTRSRLCFPAGKIESFCLIYVVLGCSVDLVGWIRMRGGGLGWIRRVGLVLGVPGLHRKALEFVVAGKV